MESKRLALRPREAARELGICGRTLWTWTKEGRIPHVRMGKTILYPVSELQAWLAQQAAANVRLENAEVPSNE